MRTTVEIPETQHRALTALAQRRGVKGFSTLVQEALASCLGNLAADDTEELLALEGTLTDAEADEMLARIQGARAVWRAP